MVSIRLQHTHSSQTWRALLKGYHSTWRVLEERLANDAGLSVDRYEILLLLATAPGQALRPSDLAERRHLTRSGATRLIDRMAHEGLVRRRPCELDGRGFLVELTDEGRERFRSAGRLHLGHLSDVFAERYTEEEMATLIALLGRLDPQEQQTDEAESTE